MSHQRKVKLPKKMFQNLLPTLPIELILEILDFYGGSFPYFKNQHELISNTFGIFSISTQPEEEEEAIRTSHFLFRYSSFNSGTRLVQYPQQVIYLQTLQKKNRNEKNCDHIDLTGEYTSIFDVLNPAVDDDEGNQVDKDPFNYLMKVIDFKQVVSLDTNRHCLEKEYLLKILKACQKKLESLSLTDDGYGGGSGPYNLQQIASNVGTNLTFFYWNSFSYLNEKLEVLTQNTPNMEHVSLYTLSSVFCYAPCIKKWNKLKRLEWGLLVTRGAFYEEPEDATTVHEFYSVLSELESLQAITCHDESIGKYGFKLPSSARVPLTELNIGLFYKYYDEGLLKDISNVKSLTRLSFEGGIDTDTLSIFEHLVELPHLEYLQLYSITDELCKIISKISSLTCLELTTFDSISNSGVLALCTLPNLKQIRYSNLNESMIHLFIEGCKTLETIFIDERCVYHRNRREFNKD